MRTRSATKANYNARNVTNSHCALGPRQEEYDVGPATAGTKQELQAMRDIGVYDMGNDDRYLADALPTMWVKRPNGAEARCRLVCKRCYQDTPDKGDANASLPLLTGLKMLLFVGRPANDSLTFYGVSTSLLHAKLKEEVYVISPVEFCPDGGAVCELRTAMFSLKPAPKAWQAHFAGAMPELGAEPNVYYFSGKGLLHDVLRRRRPSRWVSRT